VAGIIAMRYRCAVDVFGWFKKRPAVDREITLRPRDCHCHAIPGVDDGARDLEMSLAMLRLLQAAGAETIVCTSHMYPGKYDNTPDGLARAFDGLQSAAAAAGIGSGVARSSPSVRSATCCSRPTPASTRRSPCWRSCAH
jgi:hypothetical protein